MGVVQYIHGKIKLVPIVIVADEHCDKAFNQHIPTKTHTNRAKLDAIFMIAQFLAFFETCETSRASTRF